MTAYRLDPVSRRREDLDGVGTQEPVLRPAFGHPGAHPLAGEGMPDEDHPALVPGHGEATVGDRPDVEIQLPTHPGLTARPGPARPGSPKPPRTPP